MGALTAVAALHAQATKAWLMVNTTVQESIFVTDPKERAHLEKQGWKTSAAVGLYSQSQDGVLAMHRFSKAGSAGADRIFAVTDERVQAARQAGYTDEGTLGYASATQLPLASVPVYHYTKGDRNLWLIEEHDRAWAAKQGWKQQGVAFWVRADLP